MNPTYHTVPAPVPLLHQLPVRSQAFLLGMANGNVLPEQLPREHRWLSRTPKGALCLSGEGFCRMEELKSEGYASEVEQGREAADQHWQGWSAAQMPSLLGVTSHQ